MLAEYYVNKGSFTNYVITKGEGVVSEWFKAGVIFALSNAGFDYEGGGV